MKNDSNIYFVSQESYIGRILKKFGMEDSKISKIPLDPGFVRQHDDSSLLPNNDDYHSLIGALLYLTVNTRPDVAVATSILSRRVSNPTQAAWIEVKRIFRYLKGTISMKLQLGGDKDAD
jgi:hypothetical protein